MRVMQYRVHLVDISTFFESPQFLDPMLIEIEENAINAFGAVRVPKLNLAVELEQIFIVEVVGSLAISASVSK